MRKFLNLCFNTTVWSPTRSEWLNLLASLPKEERERVSAYVFQRDAKQTLIGQVLIRYCLKKLLNIEWHHLEIARNGKGRPFLQLDETLKKAKMNSFDLHVDFNVSHSGDYAIIAAGVCDRVNGAKNESAGFKVGVDIMKIDVEKTRQMYPNDSHEDIYQKELESHERVISGKFSNIERNYIYNRLNPVEKLTAFYRLWCMKESYVKALGDGIGFDLRRIECLANSELLFDLNSKKPVVVTDSQLFVDSKLVRNCKYHEQYHMSSHNAKTELHIMTICILFDDTERVTASSTTNNRQITTNEAQHTASNFVVNEFVEVSLKEILSSLVPLVDKSDQETAEIMESYWFKFSQGNS
jgi:4'-phosphopantetheinyl transferase